MPSLLGLKLITGAVVGKPSVYPLMADLLEAFSLNEESA
jgi:hypothetical protein